METNYIVNYLFDFSVIITCHIHDWGTIGNRKMFVEEYCEQQKILEEDCIKAIKHYSKYYVKNNITWFPNREDVENWYDNYKRNKK
jgi:hypothetical protein